MRSLLAAACMVLALACGRVATNRPAQTVHRVAILGDSVAHGAGDESGAGGIAGRLHALNFGVNGGRTMTVLAVLRRADVRAALRTTDVVVVSIGGNDLYGDSVARFFTLLAPSHAMARTVERIALIVDRIHAANPSARIVLLGLYDPYRTPWLDEQVARWDSRLIERLRATAPSMSSASPISSPTTPASARSIAFTPARRRTT